MSTVMTAIIPDVIKATASPETVQAAGRSAMNPSNPLGPIASSYVLKNYIRW